MLCKSSQRLFSLFRFNYTAPFVRQQCTNAICPLRKKEEILAKEFDKETSPFQDEIKQIITEMKKKLRFLKKLGYNVSNHNFKL